MLCKTQLQRDATTNNCNTRIQLSVAKMFCKCPSNYERRFMTFSDLGELTTVYFELWSIHKL